MPELPRVEMFRRHVHDTSLHHCITALTVYDESMLDDITAAALEEALLSRCLQDTQRHGKYLFISTGESWLVLHFGMTGRPVYLSWRDSPPEHTRLLVSFEDGSGLAFDCPRRFGGIALTPTVDAFLQRKDLGPDALHVSWEHFRRIFQRKRGRLKPALMDQHSIAGIGNIYADEIVFQRELHPETLVATLSEDRLHTVYDTMQEILQTAVDHNATITALPDQYLAPHRGRAGHCPRCNASLRHIQVSGRSSYVCPQCQPRP